MPAVTELPSCDWTTRLPVREGQLNSGMSVCMTPEATHWERIRLCVVTSGLAPR